MALALRVFGAILVLPGTALAGVPAIALSTSHGTDWQARWATPVQPWLWLGVAAAAVGLGLMVWTMTDFARRGRGTPAPWDPPHRLVVTGLIAMCRAGGHAAGLGRTRGRSARQVAWIVLASRHTSCRNSGC